MHIVSQKQEKGRDGNKVPIGLKDATVHHWIVLLSELPLYDLVKKITVKSKMQEKKISRVQERGFIQETEMVGRTPPNE